MQQHLTLLDTVLKTGIRQSNRTGIDTLFIPGAMMQFDLRKGFPAVTTKKLAFKAVVGELIGFLRGYDNAAQFRDLGCKIWDKNANDPGKEESPNSWLTNPNRKGEDDLGKIYGVQWRDFGGVDQVDNVLRKLYTNPTDRRMIISAWRPDEFNQMALPPCHVMYQFIADKENNLLHLCMYQRSCDLFLGVPFNVASASLFLTIMAKLTGFIPATFTHFMADTHIYVNHIDQVKEQLSRVPYTLPTLEYSGPTFDSNVDIVQFNATIFNIIDPEHFALKDYQHHDSIKADMAV